MGDLFSEILAFLNYLFELIVYVGNFLWQALLFVVQGIELIANFIWTALVTVAQAFLSFFKAVAGIFRALWDGFFKRIFSAFFRAVAAAHRWLEARLQPLIDFLKRVRAIYDRFFNQYIKPLFNVIQKIRQVLKILEFLHISFAKQLDAALAKIEGKVAQAVLTIRGVLNDLIGIAQTLADPLLLIRRPVAVMSARRVFNSLVRVLTGRPPGYFIPSPRKGAKAGLGLFPANQVFDGTAPNPPASSYLAGDDGLGNFQGFAADVPPDDSAVDDLDVLDYFDDAAWDASPCDDVVSCLRATLQRVTGAQVTSGNPA